MRAFLLFLLLVAEAFGQQSELDLGLSSITASSQSLAVDVDGSTITFTTAGVDDFTFPEAVEIRTVSGDIDLIPVGGNVGVTGDATVSGTVFIGDNTGTSVTISMNPNTGTQDALFEWQNNHSGLGPGFVFTNNNGDPVAFIEGSNEGTSGSLFRIFPQENIGASATARDYSLGFGGGSGSTQAALVFNLGDQTRGSPLQDDLDADYLGMAGSMQGFEIFGPVIAESGPYNNGHGQVAFASDGGKFLGAKSTAFFEFTPQGSTHTCDNTDLTETGGPGAGTNVCTRPLHQFAGALPDSYTVWSFGAGNDARTGRPIRKYVQKRFDSGAMPGTISNYASQDHPNHAWDGAGLLMPYGTLIIGLNGSSSTNGVSGFSSGDPIIALANGQDFTAGAVAYDSPITWGSSASPLKLGAFRVGGADVYHLRSSRPIAASSYRELAVEEFTAVSNTVDQTTSRVRMDGASNAVTATLYDCSSLSDGSVVRFVAVDTTNPLTVAAGGGDSFLGGAPTLASVGDSATVICYGAANQWEVY